MNWTKHILCC